MANMTTWDERLTYGRAAPRFLADPEGTARALGHEAAMDTPYGTSGDEEAIVGTLESLSLGSLVADAVRSAGEDGVPAEYVRNYVDGYVGALAWFVAPMGEEASR